MPKDRLYIVTGLGRKKPLLRDTLATTAKQSKILAVNAALRCEPEGDVNWRTLLSWGHHCIPITVSYRIPKS